MFEQAELRGTQMGPNGPPNAKETAQIAPEIAILENRAFWRCHRNGHFGHFGQSFPRQDGPPEKKYHLEFGLNQRDEGAHGFPTTQVPVVPRSKTPAGGV